MIITRRLGPGLLTKGLVGNLILRARREVVRLASTFMRQLSFYAPWR